jgi:hypothetical protein
MAAYTNQFFTDAFEKAKEEFSAFVTPLSMEQFSTPPAEGKWCVGEIISHLNTAGNQYLVRMNKGLEKAKTNPNSEKNIEEYQPAYLWRKFIYAVSPKSAVPLPTVGKFKPIPRKSLDKDTLLNDFLELQDGYLKVLSEAKTHHISLTTIKFGNPISSLIRMHAAVGFAIIEAHQRRHLEQAKRAVKALEKLPS